MRVHHTTSQVYLHGPGRGRLMQKIRSGIDDSHPNATVLWTSAPEFIEEAKLAFRSQARGDLARKYKACAVLFIDDFHLLGRGISSQTLMHEILLYRFDEGLPTILGADYLPSPLLGFKASLLRHLRQVAKIDSHFEARSVVALTAGPAEEKSGA